jgi:hypothetical protein
MTDRTTDVQSTSSPFLHDSALVDVLHRLGFAPEAVQELESWWWFFVPGAITPDDMASCLMSVLPLETLSEAEERRSRGRMCLPPHRPIKKLRRG